jgi:AraC-like DNA-binding protein
MRSADTPAFQTFDLVAVSVRSRLSTWAGFVCERFIRLDLSAAEPSACDRIDFADSGEVHVSRVRGSPQRVTRTAALARTDGLDFAFLNLQMAGTCMAEQDGRRSVLTAGSLALFDSARPYTLTFERPFEKWVVHMPRSWLGFGCPSDREVTCRALTAAGPLERLAIDGVRGLGHSSGQLAGAAISEIARAALRMAVTALTLPNPALTRTPGMATHTFSRAQALIEDHACDPTFDGRALADKIGCSLRLLQMAFEQQGQTVAASIWRRRLDAAAAILVNARWDHLNMAQVASACGFGTASHFAGRFRHRFGRSPLAHRRVREGPVR